MSMGEERLGDGVVVLRQWRLDDADWYAETAARDPLIQRFTAESPTLTGDEVRSAIATLLAGADDTAGFLIADARTGERLGNIALACRDGVGHVSYWLAGYARGRGAATRALSILSAWAIATFQLTELRLWTHVDNHASRSVAERAGYRRAPDLDRDREVKGQTWWTVGYVRHAGCASSGGDRNRSRHP
jgi:ribosomal-protein-alanine N-acetyltransferase